MTICASSTRKLLRQVEARQGLAPPGRSGRQALKEGLDPLLVGMQPLAPLEILGIGDFHPQFAQGAFEDLPQQLGLGLVEFNAHGGPQLPRLEAWVPDWSPWDRTGCATDDATVGGSQPS